MNFKTILLPKNANRSKNLSFMRNLDATSILFSKMKEYFLELFSRSIGRYVKDIFLRIFFVLEKIKVNLSSLYYQRKFEIEKNVTNEFTIVKLTPKHGMFYFFFFDKETGKQVQVSVLQKIYCKDSNGLFTYRKNAFSYYKDKAKDNKIEKFSIDQLNEISCYPSVGILDDRESMPYSDYLNSCEELKKIDISKNRKSVKRRKQSHLDFYNSIKVK